MVEANFVTTIQVDLAQSLVADFRQTLVKPGLGGKLTAEELRGLMLCLLCTGDAQEIPESSFQFELRLD